MATGKRLVFHLGTILHHIITLVFLNSIDFRESNSQVVKQVHDFSYKYFTVWTFVFQLIYCVCALICDIGDIKPELVELVWPKHTLLARCAKIRDFAFHTIVFPCTGHTVIGFWSMYFYDRDLVLPIEIDKYVHPMINHAMHTNVALVIALEIILGNEKKPKANIWQRALCLGALMTVYYTMVLWTYFSSGRWIYKVLQVFSTWTERCLILGLGLVSIYLMFFVGIHAQEIITEYNKKKYKAQEEIKTKNNKVKPSINGNQNVFRNFLNDVEIIKKFSY